MFKLDRVAIDQEAAQSAMSFGIEAGIRDGFTELSRQLTAAGAPPGDLETQLRTLLARPTPIEPGADMVEALARIRHEAHEAWCKAKFGGTGAGWPDTTWEGAPSDYKDASNAAIRAVLSALAGMGAEALPSVEAVLCEEDSHASPINATLRLCRAATAPILAAKDARIRELEGDKETWADYARKGASMSVMLSKYGLPDEPKALAAVIERERAAKDARIRELDAQLAAAEKLSSVWRELQEREIPCGHKVEDLICSPGKVTKCGACLVAKQASRPAVPDHIHEFGSCSHCDTTARPIGIPDPPPPPPPPGVATGPIVRWRVEFDTGAYYTMATTIDQAIAQARAGFGEGSVTGATRT